MPQARARSAARSASRACPLGACWMGVCGKAGVSFPGSFLSLTGADPACKGTVAPDDDDNRHRDPQAARAPRHPMTVRIVDIAEVSKPIASAIRNAYIDFSKMTTSLVAVVTNVERNGKPVVGYGFNSNG